MIDLSLSAVVVFSRKVGKNEKERARRGLFYSCSGRRFGKICQVSSKTRSIFLMRRNLSSVG